MKKKFLLMMMCLVFSAVVLFLTPPSSAFGGEMSLVLGLSPTTLIGFSIENPIGQPLFLVGSNFLGANVSVFLNLPSPMEIEGLTFILRRKLPTWGEENISFLVRQRLTRTLYYVKLGIAFDVVIWRPMPVLGAGALIPLGDEDAFMKVGLVWPFMPFILDIGIIFTL